MIAPTTDHAASAPVLHAKDLTVLRGSAPVVREVDLELTGSGVLAVLGRSGSGRTALLEGIAGLLVTRGTIRVDGVDVQHLPADARARQGIGLAAQGGAVFPGLTVAEHLLLAGGGGWAGLASTRLSGALRRLTDERATQRADTLSGGERRLLALAMIALREPRVVLLDEPTEGIATTLVPELVATVRSLAERSVLLLVDRQPELIRQTARSAIILERGAVVAHDTIEDLDRRGALRRVLR